MAATGNTTTLAFSAWTYAPAIESIDPPEFSVDEIDTTHLATTTYKTKVPAYLKDIGDLTVSAQFTGAISDLAIGETGTITITFPYASGYTSVRPSLASPGFVKSFKAEQITSADKMMATIVLSFDGGVATTSEPVWTAPS